MTRRDFRINQKDKTLDKLNKKWNNTKKERLPDKRDSISQINIKTRNEIIELFGKDSRWKSTH